MYDDSHPAGLTTGSHDNAYGVGAAHEKRGLAVELLIAALLQLGVRISLVIVVTGTLLTFARHWDYTFSQASLPPLLETGAVFPRTLAAVVAGIMTLDGPAIVVAGLIVLIATPLIVVATCLLAFIYHRDKVFMAISTVVLVILLFSYTRR